METKGGIDERRSVITQHGGARDNGGAGRRSPLPLSNCGDQEDGRWSMPGWRSLGEDGGGGFSTNLFTFSKGKVSSPKLSKLLILWFVFVSSA